MIRPTSHRKRSGFTLMEMTVTLVVGMMVAVMALTMFNQQLASYQILSAQNFLVSEAPQINNTLNRVVSRANFFRMYTTTADAASSTNAVIQDGTVLALKFEDSGDQSESSFGVIVYDDTNKALDYYHLTSMADLDTASPQWNISTQLQGTVFYVENGVLRIKITGPNGEEIIYSTTTQR